jgi:hypothetical protein
MKEQLSEIYWPLRITYGLVRCWPDSTNTRYPYGLAALRQSHGCINAPDERFKPFMHIVGIVEILVVSPFCWGLRGWRAGCGCLAGFDFN